MRKVIVVAYGVFAYILFVGVFVYSIGFVGDLWVPRSIDSPQAAASLGDALVDASCARTASAMPSTDGRSR